MQNDHRILLLNGYPLSSKKIVTDQELRQWSDSGQTGLRVCDALATTNSFYLPEGRKVFLLLH